MSMVNPVTWDYTSTFVGHAMGTPLYDFEGEASVLLESRNWQPVPAFEIAARASDGRRVGVIVITLMRI